MTKPSLLDGVQSIGPHPATRTESEARAGLVKTTQRPDIEGFLALVGKATPGEWSSDTTESEGSYGSGDDTHEGFKAYEIIADVRGHAVTLCDSLNSTASEIEEEFSGDEDGTYHAAWDEIARKNFEFIAAAKNIAPAIAQYALAMEKKCNALKSALEEFVEMAEEPPAKNCSCHLNPPCGDCVEYGGLRGAFKLARAALAKKAEG